MKYDYFDRIALGEIDPPPASPIRYGVRADHTEGLAFLTVGKSEAELTPEQCIALAHEMLRLAAELDTQNGGAA